MNKKEERTIKTINRSRKAKKVIGVLTMVACLAACATLGASAMVVPVVAADFASDAQSKLKFIITLIGGGVGLWGIVNLLEGYGSDNPGAKSQGLKQVLAGVGLIACATLVNSISWK